MKRTCQLSLIFLALLFSQCRKEMPLDETDDTPLSQNHTINKGNSVLASFSGKIINESGSPVPFAIINIGDKSAQTNSDGFFFVKDASVFENHAYIRVFATNYFHGSRSVLPKQGVNHVNITLLSNAAATSFPSNTGGVVTVGKAKVEFGAGYTDDLGIAYTGEVKVAMKYLDPEAANLSEIMPGDLIAASSEGTKLLESFGMLAVELKTPYGTKLQLAKGNEATLHMGLSPTALSKAPEELPLWYFDEAKGHWVEEGSAQLIDGEYVGKVKHFSFWNCDVRRNYNRIDGIVKTKDGNPLAGAKITLVSQLMGTGKCYTSSGGQFGGRVPSGEHFTLSLSYMVQNQLKSMELGPYSSDEIIPDIILDDIPDLIKIQGEAVDCQGKPVAKGLLFINDNFPVEILNGNYSFYYLKSTSYTTRYFDQGTGIYSTKKAVPGFSSNQIMPSESVCGTGGGSGSLTYEISYLIDGVLSRYTIENQCAFGYKVTMNFVEVFRYKANNVQVFKLKILNYSGPGTYTVSNQSGDSLWLGDYTNEHCTFADNVNVEVVDYFIVSNSPYNMSMDINFSGTVNVWNENKKLFEKKPLTNGRLTASR